MKRTVVYLLYFVIGLISTGAVGESYDNSKVTENTLPFMNVQEYQHILQSVSQETLNDDVKDSGGTQQRFDLTSNPVPEDSDQSYGYNGCDSAQQNLPFLPNESQYHAVEHTNLKNYVNNPWSKLFYSGFKKQPQPSNKFDLDYDTMVDTMDTSNIFNHRINGMDPTVNVYSLGRQRSDEDILEQLEHDAIIHNILPTMDEPFFRESDVYSTQGLPNVQSQDHLVAYFPKTYGPPLLLQLGCTPIIKEIHQQDVQMSSPYQLSRTVMQRDDVNVRERDPSWM